MTATRRRAAVRWTVNAWLILAAAVAAAGEAPAPSAAGLEFFDDGLEANSKTDTFEVELRATGPTDVHMLQNKIGPGGTYGWHSHPGPSIVVVQSGALTLYRAADPDCTPQVLGAGSGFVDQGGDVHVVRNEGSVDAVVYVTSIIPKGAGRRIDELDPGTCGF